MSTALSIRERTGALEKDTQGHDLYKAFHKEMEFLKLGFDVPDDEDSIYSSMYFHEDLEMLKRLNKSFNETKEESK